MPKIVTADFKIASITQLGAGDRTLIKAKSQPGPIQVTVTYESDRDNPARIGDAPHFPISVRIG